MLGDVATAWAAYEREFVPPTATAAERKARQHAFYIGITMFVGLLETALNPEKEVGEAELSRIDAIEQELLRYAEDGTAGRT